MTNKTFSQDEIDLIFRGLDSIAMARGSTNLIGLMLGAAFAKDDEQREKLKREDEARMKAEEREQRQMNDRITLLKAKLITMRDGQEIADEVADILGTK